MAVTEPTSLLSVLLFILIAVPTIIVLLQNVECGYDYQRPGARLELANNKHGPVVQGVTKGLLNEYKSLNEKKIPYSLPHQDYDYEQQHRNGENANSLNTSPYQNEHLNTYRDFPGLYPILTKSHTNIGTSAKIQSSDLKRLIVNRPNTVYGPPKTGQSQTLTHHEQLPIVAYLQNAGPHGFNVNNVQQTSHRFVPNFLNGDHNAASHLNLQNILPNFGPRLDEHFRKKPIFFNPQTIRSVQKTHDQNIQPGAPHFNIQDDLSSRNTPQVNVNINPSLKNLNNLAQPIGTQNNVSPVITKHVYFHAPPPDIEETSVEPTPPKKSYKIIFIKVPSQESRNIEELHTAYNSLEPIEDKTLIYVLSNISKDSSQLLVPAYKPSDHEVLFVKYNGNQNIGSDGNLIEQDHDVYRKR